MPSKPTNVTKRSNQSAPSRRKAKAASRQLTSDVIAADIAAFLKHGGHIEVLGNSTYRPHLASTTFRSNAESKRKPTPVKAAKKATSS